MQTSCGPCTVQRQTPCGPCTVQRQTFCGPCTVQKQTPCGPWTVQRKTLCGSLDSFYFTLHCTGIPYPKIPYRVTKKAKHGGRFFVIFKQVQ